MREETGLRSVGNVAAAVISVMLARVSMSGKGNSWSKIESSHWRSSSGDLDNGWSWKGKETFS